MSALFVIDVVVVVLGGFFSFSFEDRPSKMQYDDFLAITTTAQL